MSRPLYPRWTIDTMPYWEGCRQGELRYQLCEACGEPVFHPRAACPYCLSPGLQWKKSAGEGVVYSFTIQHVPLDRADPGPLPLTLGIVELREGFHMFAEITGADSVRIGARVGVWFDHVAPDLALPKFRVLPDAA